MDRSAEVLAEPVTDWFTGPAEGARGRAALGLGFDPQSELATWLQCRTLFSPAARPAAFCELLGAVTSRPLARIRRRPRRSPTRLTDTLGLVPTVCWYRAVAVLPALLSLGAQLRLRRRTASVIGLAR